jgi:PAS domain S-box-containing protein
MPAHGKILLIDDDPDIGLALSDYLQQEGFSVEAATTAATGIQMGLAYPFDVILLDMNLPDQDGTKVLHELSKYDPNLPIVLLTGIPSLHLTANQSLPTLIDKAFACLIKPYNRQEVKEAIWRALVARNAAVQPQTITPPDSKDFLSFLPSLPHFPSTGDTEPGPSGLQRYERLAYYAHLMHFVLDQIPEAVFVAGPDKRFHLANQAACRSLGYTREELLALRIPDIAPYHSHGHYQLRLKSLKNGGSLTYASVHRRKDGREFPIEISLFLYHFQGNDFTCAVIRPRDEKLP